MIQGAGFKIFTEPLLSDYIFVEITTFRRQLCRESTAYKTKWKSGDLFQINFQQY